MLLVLLVLFPLLLAVSTFVQLKADCPPSCLQHTAMPNTSTEERRAVIMGWVAGADAGGPMLSPAHEQHLMKTGRMTPLLQSLTAATYAV
jgi:hypothetical protein